MPSIYKNKNGFYYLKYSRDGIDKRISTKCRSKKEAYLFLRSFDPKIKSAIRLDVLKNECLMYSKRLNKAMQWQYKNTLNRFYAFTGNKLLSEISKTTVSNFVEHLKTLNSHRGKPFSAPTINMNISVLKRCFEIAVENDWILVNPVKVKKLQSTRIVPAFTLSEAELLLNELKGDYYQLVRIAFNTGIRRTALCNLKWKDIDFKDGVIYLRNKMNRKSQFVPINQVVRDILLERSKLADISGKVFSINAGYLTKLIKKVIIKLGLNPLLRFHSIRHTFGTEIVRLHGVHIGKELLNHAEINTTMKYVHTLKEELKSKVKDWAV